MKTRWIVLVLALSLSSSLQAAVVLKVETRDHSSSPPRTQTTDMVAEGRFLMMTIPASADRDGGRMIFRGDRREMIILDDRERSYIVFDAATLRSLTNQLNQAMGQMDAALKNVPENQRALMSQTMKNQLPTRQAPLRSPAQVRLLGDRANVFGYPAVRYEVIRDGRKVRELWATDWRNIDGGREVTAVFTDMAEFTQEMTDALANSFGGATSSFDDGMMAALKGVNGFPVGVREFRADGTIEREWALRSVTQQRVDPAEFELPRGYVERQIIPRR